MGYEVINHSVDAPTGADDARGGEPAAVSAVAPLPTPTLAPTSAGVDPGPAERWRPLELFADRLARLDRSLTVRLRAKEGVVRLLAWLPSGALVGTAAREAVTDPGDPVATGRAAAHPVAADSAPRAVDLVTRAGLLADWLADPAGAEYPPTTQDSWLTGIPPDHRWRRVDEVPGDVVRDLVRQGAQVHQEAADLQLGARAANSLLDTPVLVVSGGAGLSADVTNRMLGALTSLSLLPAGGHIVVAVADSWTRVAAGHGSVYARNRPGALGLIS